MDKKAKGIIFILLILIGIIRFREPTFPEALIKLVNGGTFLIAIWCLQDNVKDIIQKQYKKRSIDYPYSFVIFNNASSLIMAIYGCWYVWSLYYNGISTELSDFISIVALAFAITTDWLSYIIASLLTLGDKTKPFKESL